VLYQLPSTEILQKQAQAGAAMKASVNTHMTRRVSCVSRPEVTRRRENGRKPTMTTENPCDIQRFVAAQNAGGTYERATAELRAGRKTSHWMWFIFPQIAGLGYSPASQTYAITSLAEARAYMAHPVLGARLIECASILTRLSGRTTEQMFGGVDAMKLRSSITLFMHAAPGEPVFRQVLDQYFDGIPDSATEQRI
jgi:uncharacterized protein (DUF1810 family)